MRRTNTGMFRLSKYFGVYWLIVIVLILGARTSLDAKVTASSTSISFANQPAGSSSTPMSVVLSNSNGSRPVTITSVTSSVPQFSAPGTLLNVVIGSGQSVTIPVVFTPTATQTYAGKLVISFATGPALNISLAGTGVAAVPVQNAPGTLSFDQASLDFANVNVGASASKPLTATNKGQTAINVRNVITSGAGFNVSGISAGQILAPGQSAALNVTFAPAGAGSISGSVTITSDAANPSASVPLTGTGVSVTNTHTVTLNWNAPVSNVVGYNAYSSATAGGPYTRLTTTPILGTGYVDSTVVSGRTYFYVVTSIASDNTESVYSTEVAARVP